MKWLTIRIPKDDWQQIVSDIENMCEIRADEIEILQNATIEEETS